MDGRSLVGAGRGIAHYTSALLTALAERFPGDEWRVVVPAGDPASSLPPAVVLRRVPVPGRLLYGAAAVAGRPRLDRLSGPPPDVFWAPAPAPLAVSRDVPAVLTVHDLSWELRPSDFTTYERLWHGLARPARQARAAARVVTVSSTTREEAVRRWDLDPARVSVVAPGVRPAWKPDPDRVRRVRQALGLPERFLLYVGALEPRKAPDLLVRAFGRARQAGLEADLVLAGEGRLAPGLAAPGVHVLGRVDAETRDALYGGAVALALPSWVEGFGFTPLEALAAGTPAVVSDLPVLRETLGGAALFSPPGDEEALASALVRLAADGGLRTQLVAAGREALTRFTWPGAADAMRAVLAAAAGLP